MDAGEHAGETSLRVLRVPAESAKWSGMKRPNPLLPVVWATTVLPIEQPYCPLARTLEKLPLAQSLA